jgi:hypothetical protein
MPQHVALSDPGRTAAKALALMNPVPPTRAESDPVCR